MKEQIEHFIFNFIEQHPGELTDSFLYGNCYWFALILVQRFGGSIAYLPIENHFLAFIAGRLYDVTGEVLPEEEVVDWREYQKIEPTHAARIYKDCILKDY